jgi:hypothetical protein
VTSRCTRQIPLYLARIWHGRWLVGLACSPPVFSLRLRRRRDGIPAPDSATIRARSAIPEREARRRRLLVAAWDALQDPAYRPARPPTLRRLRQRGDAEGLTGRDALAASPGFLILLDVRRPDDGPRVDLARWGSCGITSARRSPATRCVGGNIFSNYRPSMPGLSPRHRVVALIGASARRGAATRPAHRASEHKAVGAGAISPR